MAFRWNLWVVQWKTNTDTGTLHYCTILSQSFFPPIWTPCSYLVVIGSRLINLAIPDKLAVSFYQFTVIYNISTSCDVTVCLFFVNATQFLCKQKHQMQDRKWHFAQTVHTVWYYSLPLSVAAASVGGPYSSGNFRMSVQLWPSWKAKSQLSSHLENKYSNNDAT